MDHKEKIEELKKLVMDNAQLALDLIDLIERYRSHDEEKKCDCAGCELTRIGVSTTEAELKSAYISFNMSIMANASQLIEREREEGLR